MSESPPTTWPEANQRYLTAALGVVREALERHAGSSPPGQARREPGPDSPAEQRLAEAAEDLAAPSALETLCRTFSLSDFERDVVLLGAGVELESSFAVLCAEAQGNPRRTRPTLGLALAALPGAHWSALTPGAALRRWKLIEVGSEDGLTSSVLRTDERVLHYLTGLRYADEQLAGFARPVTPDPEGLVPSHRKVAEAMATVWSESDAALPVVQLIGSESAVKRRIAAVAAARIGLGLCVMPAHVLPSAPQELELLTRLWEREAALGRNALVLDCENLAGDDEVRGGLLAQFLECTGGALVVASPERRRLRHRAAVTLEVRKPTAPEQDAIWRDALGLAASLVDGDLQRLVAHFDLGALSIRTIASHTLASADGEPGASLGERLWARCRSQARPRLGNLAQRIEPVATWDDIVLPGPQLETLREAAIHVRQRSTVYERWGFAAKSSRGLGISALFAGPSGTGKTMAAEVLANELQLDLYVIDLSRVVSKYIGETEKNLGRVFDVAEEAGAILLFDEADALFGKRSEVKDSHDRYANIEVSYLLQRMESYRGLAILTTNMKEAIDGAFLRRIRFVVQFPFPDAAQRAEIWRRIFPGGTPTEGLDVEKLARLSVAGGNIRNIAMSAAFLAAEAGEPVRMEHVLRAARGEYAKLEKPLTRGEVRQW